jgi:iron complex outermembrane receptor protein
MDFRKKLLVHHVSFLATPRFQRGPFLMRFFLLCFSIGFMPILTSAQVEDTPHVSVLKKLSVEDLMNLEVTSVNKRPEKLAGASSAIQVITQQDIRNSGATSVPEALRLATNLQVAQVNSSQWAISARGFNNVLANKLLVLIDGRVVYTPMYAGVFWDVQNLLLDNIDRIEVISGPGGTLWGSNAVNGVINIITKNAKETAGLYAEAAVGTELRGLGSLRYGGKITDKLFYRVYGTGFKRDNTIFQDSVEANDNWKMAQGGIRFDWDASEKDIVTFQSNIYEGRPDPDGGKPVLASGGNALSKWVHTIKEGSDFQVQGYYDRTWRDFRNGFAEELNTYDLEAQHSFKIRKSHEIVYGLGFRYMDHDVKNLELFAFRPARKSLYLFNVFVQDEIAVVEERLSLALGIKLEHHTYAGFQNQPSARLTWTPGSRNTVWAAASRALRAPSRIDREFHLDIAPGLAFITGSDFKSEELLAYELGWRTQPQDNLSLSISTFYNVYDNLRSVEPGPPPFGIPVTFGNGVAGDTYGAELSIRHQVNDNWDLRGGYTFLKKDLYVKPGSSDSNEGSAESNDPVHQFLIQSSVNFTERINFGTVLRYVGELADPVVSEYIGLDMRLAWQVKDFLQLSIVGQNLAKSNHTEFIPDAPAVKDVERSVYGKIVITF